MMELLKGTVSPKDWLFVGVMVAITGVICAAYYLFLYSPAQAAIAELNTENSMLSADIREAEVIEAGIQELRREGEQFDLLVTKFEQRLPQQREIPQLLTEFEILAADVGIEVELQQLAPLRDDRKETIPYSVVAYGNFHQIARFINLLERFERYLKVSDLNIEEERALVSRASFTLSTFRFLEPAPVTAAAAGGGT
jgi:Tfp pilus assembly protein PilO